MQLLYFYPGLHKRLQIYIRVDFYFAFPFQHGVMVHNVQGNRSGYGMELYYPFDIRQKGGFCVVPCIQIF